MEGGSCSILLQGDESGISEETGSSCVLDHLLNTPASESMR